MPRDPQGEVFKVLAVAEAFGAFACITEPDKGLLMLSEQVEVGDTVRVFFFKGKWNHIIQRPEPTQGEGGEGGPDNDRVPEELPRPVRPNRKHT